jgi:hypothetical protein
VVRDCSRSCRGTSRRVDRELTCAERVHMPFPRVAGLFVGERALEWSGLSSPGACATHRSSKCVAVRPEKLNEFFGPLLTCGILRL